MNPPKKQCRQAHNDTARRAPLKPHPALHSTAAGRRGMAWGARHAAIQRGQSSATQPLAGSLSPTHAWWQARRNKNEQQQRA